MNLGAILVDALIAGAKRIHDRPKAMARRAAKAARKAPRPHQPDEAAGEFFPLEKEDVTMNPLLLQIVGSLLRTAGPAATAYLAGKGITVVGLDGETIVGVAIAVYLGAQAWSLGRKLYRHFSAKLGQ